MPVKDLKMVHTYMDPKFVNELDRLADRLGTSRAQIARNLILMGLDDMKVLRRFGVIKAVEVARTMREMGRKGLLDDQKRLPVD